MHLNTINTGILDLSERAIRANKALRGHSGVLSVRQAGKENSPLGPQAMFEDETSRKAE